MKFPVETLGSGLGHPEGPDVLPDGRIVMVETYTSKIIAWSPERGIHDYAICGGGPNACMLGSDGAVYITQNGGTVGAWKADVMSVPSIQKAWPDGRVEFVVKEVAGHKLQAPNDLTFGPDGRLFFTDPGDYYPDNRGTKASWAKLNEEQVKEINQAIGGKKGTGTALARKFNVSKSAVYRIWEGKNWKI